MNLADGVVLEDLGNDVYFYYQQVERNNIYNTMFLVYDDGVVLIDPHRKAGNWLQQAIKSVTTKPVRFVLYSHYHRDHIQDAAAFRATAKYVAHANTDRLLRRKNYPGIPLPDFLLAEDSNILHFGDTELQFLYFGPNHSDDNMVVYVPKRRVAAASDVVFPGWVPFKRLTLCTDVSGLLSFFDRLVELDFDHFVAGHMLIGTKDDVQQTRNYVYAVRDLTAEALREVSFEKVIEEVASDNQFFLLTAFADRITDIVLRRLRPDWGHLKGFDVVAHTHVEHMFTHLCFGLY